MEECPYNLGNNYIIIFFLISLIFFLVNGEITKNLYRQLQGV